MAELHQLFARETTYDPERLKVLGKAFDTAWESVAERQGDASVDIEAAQQACEGHPQLALQRDSRC